MMISTLNSFSHQFIINFLIFKLKLCNLSTLIHLSHLQPHMFHSEGDVKTTVGRSNHANVDLNRNFPDVLARSHPAPQPEVQHVMKWIKQYPFVLSANLHGGSLVSHRGNELFLSSYEDFNLI